MSFWKNIKKIFKTAKESSPNQPIIHEVIQRSKKELTDYNEWKATSVKEKLLDWLRSEHVNFLVNPQSTDEAIDFLNMPSVKGFVIHLDKTEYSNKESICFFDFLKEKVLAIDYKTYLSDTRTYNRKDWVEKLERHYLKPPLNRQVPRKEVFDQRFGNITIELIFRNDKAHLLKFSAASYHDRLYQKAREFTDLMNHLYEQ